MCMYQCTDTFMHTGTIHIKLYIVFYMYGCICAYKTYSSGRASHVHTFTYMGAYVHPWVHMYVHPWVHMYIHGCICAYKTYSSGWASHVDVQPVSGKIFNVV
jgi:hypothetical protein